MTSKEITTYADLERRFNGPIPQRELDAVRWPTLEAQIVHARGRIATAERAENRARLDHPYTPSVARYHHHEAANWRRWLDERLAEQKRRVKE